MIVRSRGQWLSLAACALLAVGLPLRARPGDSGDVGDPAVVRCANLTYAGGRTARCFSDRFLRRAAEVSTIRTEPRFVRVSLDDQAALAELPFAVWTGEGTFRLNPNERANLRSYLRRGGFIVASAGCSNADWGASFRHEIAEAMPGCDLRPLPISHPIFRTVYAISSLATAQRRHGPHAAALEALTVDGRIALVFSPDGLNDTAHSQNCCCCGGDEVADSEFVNVNLLAYALLH